MSRADDELTLGGFWARPSERATVVANRIMSFVHELSGTMDATTWSIHLSKVMPWNGSRDQLARMLDENPFRDEHGVIHPDLGFAPISLCANLHGVEVETIFSAGSDFSGSRVPDHRMYARMVKSNPTTIAVYDHVLRAFVLAFDPLSAARSTREVGTMARRSGWRFLLGYQVFLHDLVGPLADVPTAFTTERLGNGTLYILPEDYSARDVVDTWQQLLDANDMDAIDNTIVQPMEVTPPPGAAPLPIPDRVPVAPPTVEREKPLVTAEDYRRQITGWDPTDDGAIPVYSVNSDTPAGLSVSYEGHTRRGPEGERYEVFLHSVFGIDHLATDPLSDLSVLTAAELLNIASWQLNALPDGAVLEWHSNTTHGATALRNLLITNGITAIRVRNTPAIGADDE